MPFHDLRIRRCFCAPELWVGGASRLEPLLEAVPQVVAGEARQHARPGRWDPDDANVRAAFAVAALVGVVLA
jgi:hypothetical protein